MNGARAIPESLAQRRLLIGTLPGMAQENKRGLELPDPSCSRPAASGDALARDAAVAPDAARNTLPGN
jgi:hypothetical protein